VNLFTYELLCLFILFNIVLFLCTFFSILHVVVQGETTHGVDCCHFHVVPQKYDLKFKFQHYLIIGQNIQAVKNVLILNRNVPIPDGTSCLKKQLLYSVRSLFESGPIHRISCSDPQHIQTIAKTATCNRLWHRLPHLLQFCFDKFWSHSMLNGPFCSQPLRLNSKTVISRKFDRFTVHFDSRRSDNTF
jgi:hypothetical protein